MAEANRWLSETYMPRHDKQFALIGFTTASIRASAYRSHDTTAFSPAKSPVGPLFQDVTA